MANWKHKLLLVDIWKRVDEMEPVDIGRAVADRIESQAWSKHYPELAVLCADFREVETIDQFNECARRLYDWADWDHLCWVETRYETGGCTA